MMLLNVIWWLMLPQACTALGALLAVGRYRKSQKNDEDGNTVAVAAGMLAVIVIELFFDICRALQQQSNIILVTISTLAGGLLFLIIVKLSPNSKSLFWPMVIHNIPEGMLIGLALAEGHLGTVIAIAIQDIADGVVVTMPALKQKTPRKAFWIGSASGFSEPVIAALIVAGSNIPNINIIATIFDSLAFSTMLCVEIGLLLDTFHSKKWKVLILSFISYLAITQFMSV